MTELTPLQRTILAFLQEAGEDDYSSLLNSVHDQSGNVSKIEAMRLAVSGLINMGLVIIANERAKISRLWLPLSIDRSLSIIEHATQLIKWSQSELLWKWPQEIPRAEVLLTKRGEIMAAKVLTEDGWPSNNQ